MARNPDHTWYVAIDDTTVPTSGRRPYSRKTVSFKNEADAKEFAEAKLFEGLNVSAGTLNPYRPKETISSAQINDWINERSEAG